MTEKFPSLKKDEHVNKKQKQKKNEYNVISSATRQLIMIRNKTLERIVEKKYLGQTIRVEKSHGN